MGEPSADLPVAPSRAGHHVAAARSSNPEFSSCYCQS